MAKFVNMTYEQFFCRFFNLNNLQEAVGKEVVVTEQIREVSWRDEYYDTAPLIETTETPATITSISYTDGEYEDYVTVALSNGMGVNLFVPFLPVTNQMSYLGWKCRKVLKKSWWPFSKKTIAFLRNFSLNGKKMNMEMI